MVVLEGGLSEILGPTSDGFIIDGLCQRGGRFGIFLLYKWHIDSAKLITKIVYVGHETLR